KDAQKALDQANDAQADAQSDVNAKQATVDQKQAAYNDTEDALKGTNVEKLQKNLADANANVAANQQKLNQATAAKNSAETNKNNATDALTAAQNAQKQAAADVSAKQVAADKTQAALNDAETALKNAQSKTQQLNDQLQSVNTITLPNGYIQALKQFEDYQEQDNGWNKETSRQLSKKIYSFSQEAKQLNQYKHNNSEKDVMVDTNNMTPEQQKELTLFAADLINQMRQQAGTPLVTVTPGSIELGKKIIKEGYNDPSWDVFGPHMTDGKSHNSNYIYSLSESVAENVDGALTSWRAENGQWVKNEHNSIQSMDAL